MHSNKKKTDNYRQYLLKLTSEVRNPAAGYFGPESIAWRINREGVLGLGALRALMMQVAHPKVAQGIASHSRYKTQPFSRVYHTLTAQQVIVFGSCAEATEVLLRMYARHATVQGALPDSPDEFYGGNDPYLQLWVLGTLVDTVIRSHALFLTPLTENELTLFYEESKWFARLMGIPVSILPPTLRDFDQWMTDMIAGEEIFITPAAEDIAQSLLRLPTPVFWPSNYILAVGMLPAEIRDGFGLKWNDRLEMLFRVGVGVARTVAGNLPIRFRTSPAYWKAVSRVQVTP